MTDQYVKTCTHQKPCVYQVSMDNEIIDMCNCISVRCHFVREVKVKP